MAVSRLALRGDIDLTRDEPSSRREQCDADFARLYSEYFVRIVGLVRRFTPDEGLIDDIAQETFLRAYNAGLHLEYQEAQERDQWPWLAAVARNLALDNLRKKHSDFTEDLEQDITESTLSPDDPELHHLASRRRAGIAEAFDAVCPRQRRVLAMKYVQGLQYHEIAEEEGMSVEALKSVLARARRAFRESYAAITERGGLGAVLGGALTGVQARLRSLRNRIASIPDAFASAMAASPAAANALATLAVLGTAGVIGMVLGSDWPAAAPPVSAASVTADPTPTVSTPTPTPMSGTDVGVAAGPAVEETPSTPVAEPTVETTTAPAPAATAPSGGGTHVEGSVSTDEVVPVQDPPAGASGGGSVAHDPDDGKVTGSNDASLDTPVQDVGVEHDAWVDCPPPERRSAAGSVVCPVLNDEESSPTRL